MTQEQTAYIAHLERENQYLKSLLDRAGIAYTLTTSQVEPYDQNQGARILPRDLGKEDLRQFYELFRGRVDVYSKRGINRKTGATLYYPQCENFWRDGCHRKYGDKTKCKDCERRAYRRLGLKQLADHLRGMAEDGTDVIGLYPLFPDGTCYFLVFDFDNHEEGAENDDFANIDENWKADVDALRQVCKNNGIDCLVERSRSGRGAHLWIFFQRAVEARMARRFGDALLRRGTESVNMKSFCYYDRMLPMQDMLPEGGLGNLIALPLQGKALLQGNAAFVDDNWNAYPDQWKTMLAVQKLSPGFMAERIREWNGQRPELSNNVDGEKPWEKTRCFAKEDVFGTMEITLADGIYVNTSNLRPRIQNRVRELAAFKNPVFAKNRAMGLSNFQENRYIYMGSDEGIYIKLPRGLQDTLLDKCKGADIPLKIVEHRSTGSPVRVNFCGQLRENQEDAVQALLEHETGILHAATAFGKTVVACNLITQRKISTLILIQSSALIDQWQAAFDQFLDFDEELPTYTTKTGRIKTRKTWSGLLQGTHDSMNGLVDIAMVGSLFKKGAFHPRLKDYGMVILDECHHAASDTIIEVLQKVSARYVYGVTATPQRGDGLERINTMLLGEIRYRFTSKERATQQGIAHLVYPRFTRAVLPRFQEGKLHPNEAYEILRNNPDRDEMIVQDVRECIAAGRTPVVLSKYVEHTKQLYNALSNQADRCFLLTGKNSKREHKRILAELKQVRIDETMILFATGSLLGEGFDFPRLDTLIMATPVAWKGIVEQYAGRLNRDYDGKKDVIIYDYVDHHIPMFESMYHKRLRAYKRIGYQLCADISADWRQKDNAIYDADTYLKVYQDDLLGAAKEIIISSPVISGGKISELIRLLKTRQEQGLQVRIVTWQPERYGFGDSSYWMELHQQMKRAGFQLSLVEDYCERYCIIDHELVWYGSMNFLGKEDADDNLMRIVNAKIVAELLELTFGSDKTVPFRVADSTT